VKQLDSAVTEEYALEIGECDCGYHFGVDFTFIDQVEDFEFECPACGEIIDTARVFPADVPIDEEVHDDDSTADSD
jgi:hypothetical protein